MAAHDRETRHALIIREENVPADIALPSDPQGYTTIAIFYASPHVPRIGERIDILSRELPAVLRDARLLWRILDVDWLLDANLLRARVIVRGEHPLPPPRR